MKEIASAFIKAKKAFGPALKDKTNPAFRSKYADLGACLEAVDGALLDNGIALYQETFDDPSGVTVETVLLHASGEVIRSGKLHVPATKQDAQGYGSALTYARRYSLMAACGIAPEDDDGNAASRREQKDSLVPVLEASIAAAKEKNSPRLLAAEQAAAMLDPAVMKALGTLSKRLAAMCEGNNAAGAAQKLAEEKLNAEEYVYLWGLLDSKVRSALKTEGQHRAMAGMPT